MDRATAAGNDRPLERPAGTKWGAKWEYGWFKGRVTLPPEAAGKRIVVMPDVGGESAVYVNGLAVGAIDHHHHEITLTTNGVPGTTYEIMIECYAGHGPRVDGRGPVPIWQEHLRHLARRGLSTGRRRGDTLPSTR